MQETTVVSIGNVASDVRFVALDSGVHRARFRIASTPRRLDRESGEWTDGTTSFMTVTCWRALADNVASSLAKGDPVIVVGRQTVREWERDDRKGTTVDIDATAVGPDLSRGSAAFLHRTRRSEPAAVRAESTVSPAPQAWSAVSPARDGRTVGPAPDPMNGHPEPAIAGAAAGL